MHDELPQSIESERAVIAACLLYPNTIKDLWGRLEPADFCDTRHKIIFKAILVVSARGAPVDLVTVKQQLGTTNQLDAAGGAPYLVAMTSELPSASNISYYAKQIKLTSAQRNLAWTTSKAQAALIDGNGQSPKAIRELKQAIDEYDSASREETAKLLSWKIYSSSEVNEWQIPELRWDVEPLIMSGGIGFMAGAPKERKSLLSLDLSLYLAQAEPRLWLGRFNTAPRRILYIAREDTAARIRLRINDICLSYKMPLPPGDNLSFIIREAIHITDDIHRKELIRIIKDGGFQFLPLDVLGRMTGDCEHFGKDIHRILGAIEEIQFETQATILSVDHIRKPQGLNKGRNTQEANPFDLYGGIQKYGAAEFILSLAKAEDNRLKIRIENKDCDEEFNFWLKVSAKDSGEPKFTWDGDIEQAAKNMKEKGDKNRMAVLDAYSEQIWRSRNIVSIDTGLSSSTVGKHTAALLEEGKLVSRGLNRKTEYLRATDRAENLPREQTNNSLPF